MPGHRPIDQAGKELEPLEEEVAGGEDDGDVNEDDIGNKADIDNPGFSPLTTTHMYILLKPHIYDRGR